MSDGHRHADQPGRVAGFRWHTPVAWLWLVVAAFVVPVLHGHPSYLTAANAVVRADGRVHLSLTFDALAFALNDRSDRIADPVMYELLNGPRAELERRMADGRRHFGRHFALVLDGADVAAELVRFPGADDVLRWRERKKDAVLPVLLAVETDLRVPPGAHTIAFRFPEIIGTTVLTVDRPGEESFTEPVEAGNASTALPVRIGEPVAPSAGRRGAAVAEGSFLAGAVRFVGLGFEHIFPRGLDHVLFVLGLFFLAGRLGGLLWQVTAFTVAHSVTLGLSLYGVVRVPAGVVEPLIALSIGHVAIDNLPGSELRWWRVAVVFGFGLVHGLGFAGALRDLGLPRSEFLRALVGFNVGVELGQLAVIGLAFVAVGWLRHRPSYRRWVVLPVSAVIGAVALFWTLQRLGAGGGG